MISADSLEFFWDCPFVVVNNFSDSRTVCRISHQNPPADVREVRPNPGRWNKPFLTHTIRITEESVESEISNFIVWWKMDPEISSSCVPARECIDACDHATHASNQTNAAAPTGMGRRDSDQR